MHAAELHVVHGVCYALFAYDVGFAIDLATCAQRLTALPPQARISLKHRAPAYFAYRPAPLRVTQEASAISVGDYHSGPQVDVVLYDFGAISLTYHIPLHDCVLSQLIALSEALDDHPLLLQDARQRVEALLTAVDGAIQRPHIADGVEDYALFHLMAVGTPCASAALYTTYAQDVAQMLRAERATFSEQEVQEVMSHRIAFSHSDVTIIDWHAALLFDQEADDVRAVLEFANVELLEMRSLDEQLDDALDQAYDAMGHRPRPRRRRPWATRADLQRVAQMQVDSAILFEGVNNALKLIGDQYLARVYRLTAQRFHLAEWDASILRKLQTLESIYQKMVDRTTQRRMEVLEWIIIVLIAVSIVLPFVTSVPWH
jgi:hypothetical protein